MLERRFKHATRTRLAFGFGLCLALACQSRPLSVSPQPTAPSSGGAGAGGSNAEAASAAASGTAGGVAEATPCPTTQNRCGAACVDEATDPQNCGGCGIACDNCTNGRCILVLASGQPGPYALAVTSSEVVWSNQGIGEVVGQMTGSAILKVPIGGGVPETLAQPDVAPSSLAVDSGYLYWPMFNLSAEHYAGVGTLPDAIMKTPLAGGATMTLASTAGPQFVTVSGGVVYWTAETGIMSVPTTGGSPVVFVNGDPPLTLAAGKAYWLGVDGFLTRGLAPGAEVTVAAAIDPALLYQGGGQIYGIAVSTTDLYWTVIGTPTGSLMKMPLSGGTPSAIDNDGDIAVAVDANSVYWSKPYAPSPVNPYAFAFRILKAPLAGGAPITLATSLGRVWSLVVDDTSVYFADLDGGNVVKVTPK
jgi:hypothetical protein